MPYRELTMIDVKEVLRRWSAGHGDRRIDRETGIVEGTHEPDGTPKTCVLQIHLRNQGSADAWIKPAKITLGDAPKGGHAPTAELVDLDERTGAAEASPAAAAAGLLLPPLGEMTLHILRTGACERGQGPLVVGYAGGVYPWHAASWDASTLKVAKSAWATSTACVAPQK